jgi:hypothetical protein
MSTLELKPWPHIHMFTSSSLRTTLGYYSIHFLERENPFIITIDLEDPIIIFGA